MYSRIWRIAIVFVAGLTASLAVGQGNRSDPVLTAMSFGQGGETYPVSQLNAFDRALERGRQLEESRFPTLAAEMIRLGSHEAAVQAQAARLWNDYFTKVADPQARARYGKALEDKDLRPDLADAWIYLLLKPNWHSKVDGARGCVIEAIMRIDSARLLKLMPEYAEAIGDPVVNYPDKANLLYGLFCAAYHVPGAPAWQAMIAIKKAIERNPGIYFFAGNFEKTFQVFINPADNDLAQAWRQLLQAEVAKPKLEAGLRTSIGVILGGGK